MVGANGTKFGEKRRFGKLLVGNKKGKEEEGRERRWGGGGHTLDGGGVNDGRFHFMCSAYCVHPYFISPNEPGDYP